MAADLVILAESGWLSNVNLVFLKLCIEVGRSNVELVLLALLLCYKSKE